MNNNYPLSHLSDFEVMIVAPLSNYDQKILLQLYMPIVGDKVISLYQALYSLVAEGCNESNIEQHEKIVRLMHLRSIERFSDIRNKLEAIGLMDTYYSDNLYVYVMKKPLDGIAFFENVELATLLEYQIGYEAYFKTYCEFVMRKLDLSKFECINHPFDDVFELELSDRIFVSQQLFTGKNNGITLSDKAFDYAYFSVLLSAHDVIKPEVLTDQQFIDTITRYSFLYQLSPDEMKDVVILSCNEKKEVDLKEIAIYAKKAYEKKGKKLGVIPKKIIHPAAGENAKLIQFLESASPNEFVKQKTGIALTASEIDMFDQLLKDTGIGIGVLNVMIGYVLEGLEGQIPSYNYFLKIIHTWKRAKVKSTLDAIHYIQKKPTSSGYKGKPTKGVPVWYEDYQKGILETKPVETLAPTTSQLDELDDFFNPNKKEENKNE